jgi:hypothetical protein
MAAGSGGRSLFQPREMLADDHSFLSDGQLCCKHSAHAHKDGNDNSGRDHAAFESEAAASISSINRRSAPIVFPHTP